MSVYPLRPDQIKYTEIDHDLLAGKDLAQSGVAWGHINDQAQTIAGAKTFTNGILTPTIAGTGNGVRVNDNLGIGITPTSKYGKLIIDGTHFTADSSNISVYNDLNQTRPFMQYVHYDSDTIGFYFDCYLDGVSDKSSWLGSNYSIQKTGDLFKILYDSGVTPGNPITWNKGFIMNNTGNIGIGKDPSSYVMEIIDNFSVFSSSNAIFNMTGGGSSSMRCTIIQNTIDSRGAGILIDQGTPEWFIGTNYNWGSAGYFQIGYDASGGQAEYAANGKLTIYTTGKIRIGEFADSDAQLVNLRAYSNIPTSWKGGAAFGYSSASVIMGQLSGVATIGGHNATLNAWQHLDVNPGGTVKLGTKVGINTTPSSASSLIMVNNPTGIYNEIVRIDGYGSQYFYFMTGRNNGVLKWYIDWTGYYGTSDIRTKKDISNLNNCLEKILALSGRYFRFNEQSELDNLNIGFIAQETETVLPEAVKTDKEGYKAINYSCIIPVITEAIKELNNRIIVLEGQ